MSIVIVEFDITLSAVAWAQFSAKQLLEQSPLRKKFKSREDKEGFFEGGCVFDLLFL